MKIGERMLNHGFNFRHLGGFYTADRREYAACERLRKRRLLMFWNGRRSQFWQSQFFTITENGEAELYKIRKRAASR